MSRIRLVIVLALVLLAALYVGYKRVGIERSASRVEIAMDWSDFQALSRSYDYNQNAFLIALRRAGLTSLAVSEELGGSINGGRAAYVTGGQALLDQARIGGIADPVLAAFVRQGKIAPNEVYLSVFTPEAQKRYLSQLRLHFDERSIHVLRDRLPYLIAVRTQLDYFDALGLGLPEEPLATARRLGFLLIPRLQNDERFNGSQIDAEFADVLAHERVSTMIFFGLRNEVLGYPQHVDDTAVAFKRTHINFGSIETYDKSQVQKGDEELATRIVGQTVRVQAIAKAELDKLDFETVVARYLLGARERNVRVLYVRPLLHQDGAHSIQSTNVELIARLADGLRVRGLRLGRATPVPGFRVASRVNPIFIGFITLGAPTLLLLLFDLLGRPATQKTMLLFYAIDLAVFIAGTALHHQLLACKLIALVAAVLFAVLAVVALAPVFISSAPATTGAALIAGFRVLGTTTGLALCGALLVVGLLSTPLMMEEIERFSGVKAILLLPPLIVLTIYLFTKTFGCKPVNIAAAFSEPVRVYQLLVATVLLVAGVVYLARSGNQSDIAPSAFELALRSKLTVLLSVRPRFKEFIIGFPAMMLLPALYPQDKRRIGWLLALAISVGTSDIIDTFSHLHTGVGVSLLRIVNGAVVGAVIGAILVAVYRSRRKVQTLELSR